MRRWLILNWIKSGEIFTSSVLVASLWLKSPDPGGKLTNRHILSLSPLISRNQNMVLGDGSC